MTVRLSDEARQYIALFEEATDVAARDCVIERTAEGESERPDEREPEDRVVFVVPAGEMSQAIGPGGRHVSRVEEKLGKRVELVEDADSADVFVANALRPAAVYEVTVRERDGETVAYAEVDRDDMGAAIGAGGRNIQMAARLADRHFDVDAVELVPDPDSASDTFEAETGVEPHDCLFDPEDERLVFVVPSGDLTEAVGDSGEHVERLRQDLGWPVEVVEYAGDAETFIANAFAPATVHNVTVSEGETTVAYVEVDHEDRGVAIGAGGQRIRRARLLAKRYYDVDEVELT